MEDQINTSKFISKFSSVQTNVLLGPLFMYSNVTNLIHQTKYMKRSTFESIKFDPFKFGSTQELSSSGLHGKIDCGATSIQTSNFSCAE